MGLLYSVYLDASGKPETDASLVVAGAVAPVKNWIRFERAWKSVLDDEGVSEFHATDFAASQGEYRKWKGDRDRRASFLKRLREIIEKNVNRLFMVTVEIEAWNKVNRDYLLEEVFHSPYALAGFSAVAQLRKWAKKKKIKSPVKIVFEEGDDGWDGLNELCKREHVIPIRLPKQKAVPCQVGDLVAWKIRIASTNSLRRLGSSPATVAEAEANLQGIKSELESMEKALVRPGFNGVYGPNALLRTCKKSNVPRRATIRPTTFI
jgi:hypothetical protein